jgi:phosphoribosylglycinamide formyltransferase 2
LVKGESSQVVFGNVAHALSLKSTDIRLFGKPEVQGTRRMGVALARDVDVQQAVDKAKEVVNRLEVTL